MNDKIKMLYDKDDKVAYKKLLELESEVVESNELYNYFDDLILMLNNERTFVRVRAFRLICALAKWDNENKIENNFDLILKELDDLKHAIHFSYIWFLPKTFLFCSQHPRQLSNIWALQD